METKNIIGFVVLGLIIVGAGYLNKPVVNVQVEPATQSTPSYGGTSPIILSDYLIVGGVKTSYRQAEYTATSSSVCKLQAPTNATSTLLTITAKTDKILIPSVPVLYISTSSATSVGYGSSTPSFIAAATVATTTPLFWVAPGIATTTGNVWGTTPNNLGDGRTDFVLAPSEWITFRLATTTPGTFAAGYLEGSCSAEFREF